MKIEKLFLKFIQDTKPVFPHGRDMCVFLTGGMAIKIITKKYRKSIGKKLPSKDFDFTWAFSKKPTLKNMMDMFRFTKKLGVDFSKQLGPSAKVVFKKTRFSTPKLQNERLQKYIYAHCNVTIKLGAEEFDLMDAVLAHFPGVSDGILNKTMSNAYSVPLPKLRFLYTDTLSVVKKTLIGTGYNAWRNPIKSTHPNHPENYKQKGLKNLNRLLLIQNILKLNDNRARNIIAVDRIVRSDLPIRQKLAVARSIGKLMNKNISKYM